MRRLPVTSSLALAALRLPRRTLLTSASGAASAAGAAGLLLPIAGRVPAAFAQTGGAPSVQPAGADLADWPIPDGHFYTQSAPHDAPKDAGFVVDNGGGIGLWRDYTGMGGPAQLGYPISTRFDMGGETYQATQTALLSWNPTAGRVEIHPVFRTLAEIEMDGLLEAMGIPPTDPELLEDPDLPATTRLGWLTNPYLAIAYRGAAEGDGQRRFGLPMSRPQRFGPYLAQRFEKSVLQLWLDDVPGISAGTVTLAQVGDLLREVKLIPDYALEPQVAPAPRPAPTAVVPAVAGAAPVSSANGKHIVISIARQWFFAYEDGRLEYNGPVTTGRPELLTPLGRFTVMSRHSPYTFVSPWGRGSPFWYETATSSYALRITDNGVFLHDAPWRPFNGPGTNVPHVDPDGVWRTGSHGCINMRLPDAAWTYRWAPVGTRVDVIPA
jgi:lipoprotein-anchoring transpeptidase ErfK/SrfK